MLRSTNPLLLRPVIVLFGALIFAVDAFTPLDIAIAVLYVIVILASVHAWPRQLLRITALCLVLTFFAYFFSNWDNLADASAARCAVSMAAIGITGYLAHSNQRANERLWQQEETLRESRNQLWHAARVSTLGELAASIAHEVNQPLAAISANGSAAMRWLNRPQPELEEVRIAISRIQTDTSRASEVISRIRALARRSGPEQQPVDLNEVAAESAALVQRELASHCVTLRLSLTPALPPVLGDRVQLQQVIINLLMNGMQAMDSQGGGRLELSTLQNTEGTVQLSVADTGPGIPGENLVRLFDPFFSTKPDGMGMGLAISRSIIDSHGGRIAATSSHEGAVLQCTLPALGGVAA
jgi:C4-dicarboxylate-specific signal transduction histidine kinase